MLMRGAMKPRVFFDGFMTPFDRFDTFEGLVLPVVLRLLRCSLAYGGQLLCVLGDDRDCFLPLALPTCHKARMAGGLAERSIP